MTPVKFPEANKYFGPPRGMTENECMGVHTYIGRIEKGAFNGSPQVITAWKPSQKEIQALQSGALLYLNLITNGLPPHAITTNFEEAKNAV